MTLEKPIIATMNSAISAIISILLIIVAGSFSKHSNASNTPTEFLKLEQLINSSDKWNSKSEYAYSVFFSDLIYSQIITNEKMKKFNKDFLKTKSITAGACIADRIQKNHTNPSSLLRDLISQNKKAFADIAQLNVLCLKK